jgi:hypothetical protein
VQVQAWWYTQWFSDPGFKADVVTQWNTLKKNGVFTAWLASIQQQAQRLEQSQANNFGRWPMLGIEVWPDPEAAGSYAGEVRYFTEWLNLRIAYLDSLFNDKTSTSTTLGAVSGPLYAGSAATLKAQVTGGSTPTGVVSFLSSGVLVGTGSLNAGGAASLTIGNLPAGSDNLQAVYNGDNSNALSASAAQAVTVAAPRAATVTSIAGPFPVAGPDAPAGFTASVIGNSGTTVPTGSVTFTVDLDSGAAVTLDASGQARYSALQLSPGTHAITASYSGDTNYSAGSATPIIFQPSPREPLRRDLLGRRTPTLGTFPDAGPN